MLNFIIIKALEFYFVSDKIILQTKVHALQIWAEVMKLVDVPDSKSGVVHPTCRFDSGLRHIKLPFGSFFGSGVELPVLTSHKTILNRFARQSGLRHIKLPSGSFFSNGVEPPVLTSHKILFLEFIQVYCFFVFTIFEV